MMPAHEDCKAHKALPRVSTARVLCHIDAVVWQLQYRRCCMAADKSALQYCCCLTDAADAAQMLLYLWCRIVPRAAHTGFIPMPQCMAVTNR